MLVDPVAAVVISRPRPNRRSDTNTRRAVASAALTWLLASILLSGAPASATTIHVPADQRTIGAGIAAASNGDTVEVASGTYAGSQVLELDFAGKDIVLRSAEGSAATVLDCQWFGRAFHFESPVPPTARVVGFTIRKGYVVDDGGAVLIENGAGPTFDGCRFEDCDAGEGGGIYVAPGANARFVDCVIQNCDCLRFGGGVYVGKYADAHFERCTIGDCFAGQNQGSGHGGAVYVATGGDVRLITSTLFRNWATQDHWKYSERLEGTIGADAGSTVLIDGCHISESGGIVMREGSTTVIVHSSIERLFSAIRVEGGELHMIDTDVRDCGGLGAQVRVIDGVAWISTCRFVTNNGDNDGGDGAGIAALDSQLRVSSTIIVGNKSHTSAAALAIWNCDVDIEQCTISSNRPEYSQGAAIDCVASTVSIAHSIVWDNCPESIAVRDGAIVSLSCCDVDSALLVPSVGITADAECFSVDPEFCRGLSCTSVPFAEGDYFLSLGSPCRPLESPCGVLVGALDYGCVASDAGGACCGDDGTCTLTYAEDCSAAGTTFEGEGSACDPNPCVGACCLDDGTCVVVSPTQCDAQAGIFTAPAMACEAIECVPPGACCLRDGSCRLLVETDCGEDVGAYLGDGVPCDPIPCDPHGACCRPGQGCIQRIRSECHTIGGTYLGDGSECPLAACGADHNPGGVLLLHANPELLYTQGGDYCGASGVGTLEDITTTTPTGQTSLLHVLAAFPEEIEPHVSGAVFGIDYDAAKLQISAWGSCGDWGYDLGGWPAPQSGAYVRWNRSHTEHLFEVYWLAAYASEPTTLRLIRHLAEGGDFLGPPEDPTPNAIVCFGAMGFGEPGVVCVPQLAAGACCVSENHCVFLSASLCAAAGGQFIGYDEPCVPLPCAASTVPGFDASEGSSIVLIGSNPVQHELRFQLNAARSGPAVVRLLGVGGNVIATLFNGQLERGAQELTWTPTGATMQGVYWLDARFAGEQVTRKLILMR